MQTTTVSTAQVAPAERLEFWEAWNHSSLVGLRCSTLLAEGLQVSARQRILGDVVITEIDGEQHSVERSPQALRRRPGDSIFISILTRGTAVFATPDGMIVGHAGESILYPTDQPYLFGFDRAMSQLILTVPTDLAYGEWGLTPAHSPRLLTPEHSRQLHRAASAALSAPTDASRPRHETGGLRPTNALSKADALHQADALSALIRACRGEVSPLTELRARAIADIRRRLSDESLTPSTLAAALGVSERQLRRAFAASDDTASGTIQAERLDAAHRMLQADPPPTVTDVAARFAFASPAHFSRVFRARFGLPPSAARASATQPAYTG